MSKSFNEQRIEIEKQIKQLKIKEKQLAKQEKAEADKARIRRQTNRGGLIEKLIPHLAELSDTEFEAYINKTLSSEKTTALHETPQSEIIKKVGDENDEE